MDKEIPENQNEKFRYDPLEYSLMLDLCKGFDLYKNLLEYVVEKYKNDIHPQKIIIFKMKMERIAGLILHTIKISDKKYNENDDFVLIEWWRSNQIQDHINLIDDHMTELAFLFGDECCCIDGLINFLIYHWLGGIKNLKLWKKDRKDQAMKDPNDTRLWQ